MSGFLGSGRNKSERIIPEHILVIQVVLSIISITQT